MEAQAITAEDEIRADEIIAKATWTFAKTMPEAPHEYVVRGRDDDVSHEEFEFLIEHIRRHGVRAKSPHGSQPYIYLVIGEWKYWTLGWPVRQTTIINRARTSAEDPTFAQQQLKGLI